MLLYPWLQVEPQQQQLAQSPSLQPQNSWDTPFAMENYVLRGVGPEGRTRSNSTVSAGSMGGLMTLDGLPMATKVRYLYMFCYFLSYPAQKNIQTCVGQAFDPVRHFLMLLLKKKPGIIKG